MLMQHKLLRSASAQLSQLRRRLQQHRSLSNYKKISYACGTNDTPLLGSTVGELLDASAERNPDREAFVFCFGNDGEDATVRRSVGQFAEDVERLASGLLSTGLQPGDRLGVWGPNSQQWLTAQFAAAKAGLILVNINPAYRAHELEFCVNLVGVRGILAAPTFKTSDYYAMLTQLCPQLPQSARGKLSCSNMPSLSHVISMSSTELGGTFSYEELSQSSIDTDRLRQIGRQLQMDDIVNIQFTSGTTGSPKGAALTHHNILNNAFFVGRRCLYHENQTRICVPVPFYHCFGMGLGNLQIVLHDASCVYPSPFFNSEATLRSVHQHRCNSLYGTPTMLIDILADPQLKKYDLSSLRTGIIAGSPCPVEVMKAIIKDLNMHEVTIAYGTTENSPVTFQSMPDDSLEKTTTTVGRPSAHVEVKIIDSEGRVAEVGQQGEICIRGYTVFRGYYNNEEKTRQVIDENGWFHTGDIGFLDEDGYGHICGRINDMVIRGGENLYPVEIENFLHQHPSIEDVQVVGVPDSRMGEELCAVVKLRSGESLTAEQLKQFCRGEIAHFKIPRYITFADSYPMTVTGKVQKYKLREAVIQQLGLQHDQQLE